MAVPGLQRFFEKKTQEEGWDSAWQEKVTPWDAGNVTPTVAELISSGTLPDGRVLVPGCGSGYDVQAFASATRKVTGLDISATAVATAKQLQANSNNLFAQTNVEYLSADFFTFQPPEPFNLIFDYTFFCALPPTLRPSWAAKMAELLAPGGELITLVFPIGEHEGGPPFAVNVDAYKNLLEPLGIREVSRAPVVNSVKGREGRENLVRWIKTATADL